MRDVTTRLGEQGRQKLFWAIMSDRRGSKEPLPTIRELAPEVMNKWGQWRTKRSVKVHGSNGKQDLLRTAFRETEHEDENSRVDSWRDCEYLPGRGPPGG